MPKNKGKGGKAHRRGAKHDDTNKRELRFKGDMQDYGVVTAMLGGERVELRDTSNTKRMGHICGQMRRKVWISVGDVVLISLREYQKDGKCDIIYKYEADEIRNLKAYGEIADDSKEKKDDVLFGDSDEGEGGSDHNEAVSESSEEESSQNDE